MSESGEQNYMEDEKVSLANIIHLAITRCGASNRLVRGILVPEDIFLP
jgi:hypothetical protein